MNSFGDAPHSFPRGPRGRRRSRRRPPRVRPHLANFLSPSSTTTTTTTTTSLHHQGHLALQPITRFSRPQDSTSTDGVPLSAFCDLGFNKDILLRLQTASPSLREQAFWTICLQVFEFFQHHRVPVELQWTKILLSKQYPGPQTELVLYNPASRYQQEFEEEEELGRGGFGRVVRARKKLDGRCYAVKMIITEDLGESSLEACVSEVRTLAELDHPRVVRYFTAWVQHEVWPVHNSGNSVKVTEMSTGDSQDGSSTDSSDENDMFLHGPEACRRNSGSPGEDSVVFQESDPGKGESHPASRRVTPIHPHPRHTPVRPSGQLLPFRRPMAPLSKKVLYIQMRLYGKSLRKWIDERNEVDSPVVVKAKCLSIFSQVVEAVCYIHQQGYIHRDIKPANILFTLEGDDVQLGDFGLARLITHPSSSDSSNTTLTLQTLHPLTLNVGTPLYTAPEVKGGNYGEKSDMYSLGIILLELFMPFKTKSELSFVIRNLKLKHNLDPEFTFHWPAIAHWIKRLVDQDPENRPTAKELLESPLFPQLLPPPSPTTTTGEIDVGWSGRSLTQGSHVMENSTSINLTQMKFSAVSTTQRTHVSMENCVDMSGFDVGERLSKDEQIELLKRENDALKRELEAMRRDLKRCQIGDTTQPADL